MIKVLEAKPGSDDEEDNDEAMNVDVEGSYCRVFRVLNVVKVWKKLARLAKVKMRMMMTRSNFKDERGNKFRNIPLYILLIVVFI